MNPMQMPITVGFISENWITNQFVDALTGTGGLGNELTAIVHKGNSGNASVIAGLQDGLSGIAASVTTSMQALALSIALVFFLIALLELSTTERLTLEFFIKFFSKLVISVALILMIPTLLTLIPQFGGALADSYNKSSFTLGGYTGTMPGDDAMRAQIANIVNKAYNEPGMKMACVFEGFVFGVVMKIASYLIIGVAYVVCISRLLELTLRGCFMPIAVALIADDGWRGAGGRYIRKYIAVACQGAVIVMIGKITQFIMGAAGAKVLENMSAVAGDYSLSAPISACFIFLAIAVACVSMLFKSIGIVNDVFGA